MILIYKTLSKAELMNSLNETIPLLQEWFKNNPDRTYCCAELWYGNKHTLTRDKFLNELNEIVKNTETLSEITEEDQKEIDSLCKKDPIVRSFWDIICQIKKPEE